MNHLHRPPVPRLRSLLEPIPWEILENIPLLLCNHRYDLVCLSVSPLLRLHTEIFAVPRLKWGWWKRRYLAASYKVSGGEEGSSELPGWGLYTICKRMALIGDAPQGMSA